MTHSPGPWRAHLHRTAKNYRWQVWQDKSQQPGYGELKIADDVTWEADARLMAQAPELLEALRFVAEAYQRHFDSMPVAWQTVDNIVRATIARAAGSEE